MTAALVIPQANPKAGYLARQSEIEAALLSAAQSGWYVLGAEVEAFEQEFAAYVGREFGIGVANGTDAIELALRACGIGPADPVFTVSHTAVATVAAIDRIGAVPILVDIEPVRGTLDPNRLEDALREADARGLLRADRPRAVVPVHLYGQPADMPAILEIARRWGLRVVEDCAQAHGADLDGRRLGGWGELAAFSFYPTKNLGALGDGGMVVTADRALADRLRVLRQYGWVERYVSSVRGCNSRLDELQAAVLRVRLQGLDEDNRRRRRCAALYDELLADTGEPLGLPRPADGHVYHQYVVRLPERAELGRYLAAQGIGTSVHYPVPVHRQPAYTGIVQVFGELPVTEAVASEVLSLPMYPELTDGQVRQVASCIHRWRAAAPTT